MAIITPEINPEPIHAAEIQSDATPETFGGGSGLEAVGQQAERVAMQGADIATFERIRHDQTAVEEAVGSKLSPALTSMLYDPKNGAIARISQSTSSDDALKIQQDTLKQYNKVARDIASNLNGEQQIGAYNKHAIAFGDTLNKTLMAHVDQQIKAHDVKSFDSFVDNVTNQDAIGWGLHVNNPGYQKERLSMIQDHIDGFSFRNGLGKDEKDSLSSRVYSNYYGSIVDRMVADGQYQKARNYFEDHKDNISDLNIRANVEKNLDVVPKQQEEEAKRAREQKYIDNERQLNLNIASGNGSLSELDRMYRNDDIDKSAYYHFQQKLSDPTYLDTRTMDTSDPVTFNAIREAQLHGASPREITSMITEGMATKTDDGKKYMISPEDVKYLTTLTKEMPPTPRDRELDATANSIRDFGNRYYDPGSPLFGNTFGQVDKIAQTRNAESESLVQEFYKQADKEKATGERLQEIKDEIQQRAIAKKYPGLKGKDLPDVIVNIHGKVIKLLDPDNKSKAKAAYKITPVSSKDSEEE